METPQGINERGIYIAEPRKIAKSFYIFFSLLLTIFNQSKVCI